MEVVVKYVKHLVCICHRKLNCWMVLSVKKSSIGVKQRRVAIRVG